MAEITFSAATLTSAQMNTYAKHTGDAWNTYTPAIVQSGTVTKTTNYAAYWRGGRKISVNVLCTMTGSGTSSNIVTVSLPVTAKTGSVAFGSGYIYDASTGIYYPGIAYLATASTIAFIDSTQSSTSPTLGAAGFTAALASGDIVNFSMTYESAS